MLLPIHSNTFLILPRASISSPFPLPHIHRPADQSASSITHLFAICNTTYIYYTIPYHTRLEYTIPYHIISYHTIPYHTIPYHTIPPPSSLILLPIPSNPFLLPPYLSILSPFPPTHIHYPADQSASSITHLFAICNTIYYILYPTILYYTRLYIIILSIPYYTIPYHTRLYHTSSSYPYHTTPY